MGRSSQKMPDFDPPDENGLFLASRNGLRTYADLDRYKEFFLQLLIDHEVDLSRPIGFLSNSRDEQVMAIASCWLLGLRFVCFNPKATRDELARQLDGFTPAVIFTDEDHRSAIPEELCIEIDLLEPDQALEMNLTLGTKAQKFTPVVTPEKVFGYFFTSGTTGDPKIVPLKRRQMELAAEASANNFRPLTNHFWLLCLPLNHIGGVAVILRSLLYGSGIYRMSSFDEEMITTFLSENPLVQVASLVPTMLKKLMEQKAFTVHKNLLALLLGGGPVSSVLIQEAISRGIPVVSSYGMTETCAQIAANPLLKPSGTYAPRNSVGEIFSPNEIQIRDENGTPLGPNNSGTIWLKGPQVFDGYLDSEMTRQAFDEDGWFNTGDYGHMNAHDQLFIESRRSDMIVTGGVNVSPFEVESELEKIEPVSEAAVFGIPDEEWGQKVVAVVAVKAEQSIEAEELQLKLKERLSAYKVPKQILQADSLPKTQTGKLNREELLKMFLKRS
ncbi:MAG: AMP-binding protein [Balneolaceae bacterium]|nr:AMP-binding protein [Balneolaceae bacterium]